MKLDRLDSTTAHFSGDAVARAREAAAGSIRRVEAQEGVEGDRERSLRQELAEIDPRAVGPFAGQAQILDEAHRLAQELAHLDNSSRLLRKVPPPIAERTPLDTAA